MAARPWPPTSPEWAQPIWGWPTDYQTALGSAPGIFSLPFANVTPFQVGWRKLYRVHESARFAGVYGHAWGFDAGSHPNAAGANASAYESIRAFDNMPVQGGIGRSDIQPGDRASFTWPQPSLVADPDDSFGIRQHRGDQS